MIRIGDQREKLFTTHQFSTGAAMDADAPPTGTAYRNGAANALTVTVANITTGLYKATFQPDALDGFESSDDIDIRISATVDGVAGEAIIFSDICQNADTDDITTSIGNLQELVDDVTEADGVILSATQANYAPAKAGDNMGSVTSMSDAGASLTAIGDTRIAYLDAPVSGAGSGLSQADVRTAVGLAAANLDAQFAGLPTDADVNVACDTAISDAALATAAALAAVKLKTDLIPASPAAVGSAMTLHSDYDAAKTAASQTTANAIKAKTDNLPASPAAVGSAMTLTAAYDAAKTAAQALVCSEARLAELDAANLPADAAAISALVAAVQAAVAALNNLSQAQSQTAAAAAIAAATLPTVAQMNARSLPSAEIATAAAQTAVQADVTLLKRVAKNRRKHSGETFTIYGDDGETPLLVGAVKDKDGAVIDSTHYSPTTPAEVSELEDA